MQTDLTVELNNKTTKKINNNKKKKQKTKNKTKDWSYFGY
jgi:hypothetical protein